jgi:hypothetical protein
MPKKCYLCLRIDSREYFRELRELGFSPIAARFTVGLVERVYRANPSLLAGKSARVVKASLAYVGGIMQNVQKRHKYYSRRVRSPIRQIDCAKKFNCNFMSIRSTYVPICKTLGIDVRDLPNVADRNFRNRGGSTAYHSKQAACRVSSLHEHPF